MSIGTLFMEKAEDVHLSANTRLSLMVLWDDMERTHEHRHFDSVEDLAVGIKDILKGGNLPRSGVASLTIAPEEPRAVRREWVWRRAWARARPLAKAPTHAAGAAA
jgi:hypothetical protein